MYLDGMINKNTVIKALDHALNEEEGMSAIRTYWDMYTSLEQQMEFNDSYVTFEACVRRRYNVMTGDTL